MTRGQIDALILTAGLFVAYATLRWDNRRELRRQRARRFTGNRHE